MKIGSFVVAAEQLEDACPASFTVAPLTRGEIVDLTRDDDGRTLYLVAFEGAPEAVEVEAAQVASFATA